MKYKHWQWRGKRRFSGGGRRGVPLPTPGRQSRFGGRQFKRITGQRRPGTLGRDLGIDVMTTNVPTLTLAEIKMQFFDRLVFAKAERAEWKVMSRFGAFARGVMRKLMVYSRGRQQKYKRGAKKGQKKPYRTHIPSTAPAAPKAHMEHPFIRKFTLHWYDKKLASVVIGPMKLLSKTKISKTVPQVHNEGGLMLHRARSGRMRQHVYPARKFTEPTDQVVKPKLSEFWRDAIN